MNKPARALRDFLAEVASYDYVKDPIPKALCARAAGLMEGLEPKRRRQHRDLAPGRSKPTKEQYREATAALRTDLIALVGPYCERCRDWTPTACGHMHHTISGSGKRRQQQAIENVAWLCSRCHDVMHREPKLAREFKEKLKLIRAFGHPQRAQGGTP